MVKAKAPVRVTSYSGKPLMRAGRELKLFKSVEAEEREKAARVARRQKAKRRQLEAAKILAGYVSATTGRRNVELTQALKSVSAYYGENLFKGRPDRFRAALNAELPGAIIAAAADGPPPDLDYSTEDMQGDPFLSRYQRSAKAYNEQLRKLGYREWDDETGWSIVPDNRPLPAPLETDIRRLARDSLRWIRYANRPQRRNFEPVVKIRDAAAGDQRRKLAPDTRSDGTDPENDYQDTRGWQLYDRRHQPDPAEYDIEAAVAEGDIQIAGTAYANSELSPEGTEEQRSWKYEFSGMSSLAVLLDSESSPEDKESEDENFETYVRYEDETGKRHTIKTSKLVDLRYELDGKGESKFGLTKRQREIFGCYYGTADMTTVDIAERLKGLGFKASKRTVQYNLSEIRRKMTEAEIRLPAQAERRGRTAV